MIGPIIVPMPQTAIALACRSGGFERSSTDCDNGTSAAPQIPCSTRLRTSWTRLVAAPHNADAMVNPTTETKNTHLMPNRPASQPVSGVMIAAATMYEVTTQAIWSCEQE